MKSFLRLIALISLVSVAYLCFNQGADTYAHWREKNNISAELGDLQLTLEDLQKQRAQIVKKTGGSAVKEALLRDVVADFLLMLKELPPELSVADIAYDQKIADTIDASTVNNDLGLSFLSMTLKLNYNDYTVAVAVFLDWFAYSSLPIIIKRLDVNAGVMSIKLEIYGLKSR